jgi:hypothetical protein
MLSDQGTDPHQPQDVRCANVSAARHDYLDLSGHVYRLGTQGEDLVADRWDVRLNAWLPFDLVLGAPLIQVGFLGSPVGDTSTHSTPFAYHQGPRDPCPVVYSSALACTDAPLASMGSDGRFCGQPSLTGLVGPLGPLLSCGDNLIAAERECPRLWASPDPPKGEWKRLGDPAWESRGNTRVSHLTQHEGQLQVFLDNPTTGFEVWGSDDAGAHWTPIIVHGAYRYRRNALVTAVTRAQGHTFFATASVDADPFGSGRTVGFEFLVLAPSGHWAVLAGDCRCTPDGLRVPLLGRGPGLDQADDLRVTGLGCTEDALFLLTGKRRLWRLAENEAERLSIEGDPVPAAIVASQGAIWLALGDDESLALQRLS